MFRWCETGAGFLINDETLLGHRDVGHHVASIERELTLAVLLIRIKDGYWIKTRIKIYDAILLVSRLNKDKGQ